jgi:hypothetical protein
MHARVAEMYATIRSAYLVTKKRDTFHVLLVKDENKATTLCAKYDVIIIKTRPGSSQGTRFTTPLPTCSKIVILVEPPVFCAKLEAFKTASKTCSFTARPVSVRGRSMRLASCDLVRVVMTDAWRSIGGCFGPNRECPVPPRDRLLRFSLQEQYDRIFCY